MSTPERIEKMLDYLDLGPVALAESVGLAKTRIYDLKYARVKKVALDVADAVCRKFPTISKEWLLTGEGDMLTNQNQTDTNIKFIETQQDATLELLRQEQVLMREELAMMRQELTLMRQLLSRDQYAIGIASDNPPK